MRRSATLASVDDDAEGVSDQAIRLLGVEDLVEEDVTRSSG
jgi:hypothetical protein